VPGVEFEHVEVAPIIGAFRHMCRARLRPLRDGNYDVADRQAAYETRRRRSETARSFSGATLPNLPAPTLSRGLERASRLATKIAYRNGGRIGIPKGGNKDCRDVQAAPVLPVGYVDSASWIADRRMILASYRLADLLMRLLGN
jgi:hypothetical protein